MFGRILLLLLITPIVELALLIRLGDWIGFWPTIAIIVATALAGSILLRHEGLAVWRRFNDRLNAGGLPGKELVDGVIILVAGALLLTPGVLTDLIGMGGLLPPTRAIIRSQVMKRVKKALRSGTGRANVFFFGGAPEPPPGEDEWGGTPSERPQHRTTDGDPL